MKDGKFETMNERQEWRGFAEAASTAAEVLLTTGEGYGDGRNLPAELAAKAGEIADAQLAELQKRSPKSDTLDRVLEQLIQSVRELARDFALDDPDTVTRRRNDQLKRLFQALDNAEMDLARYRGDPEGRIWR